MYYVAEMPFLNVIKEDESNHQFLNAFVWEEAYL